MSISGKKGFTLIELLVVIAIIGILSSVVLASLNTAREGARDARRQSDLGQLQLALELFYDDEGNYPTDAEGLDILATDGHIPTVPSDPDSDRSYGYDASSDGNDYCLGADFEGDAPDGGIASCIGDGTGDPELDDDADCGSGQVCDHAISP